ncbi:TetR/AcrR family transcriptional regulator [Clostridium fungisolvens]|uniref:Tetracycline repressor protein class B from transposon Tn10 n=1 Tax=Clostridium fungisolvens TaxID=1604897 RepID=A0A6V8SNQ3_9CLOT|nr:TetR/AcrR family transcriptional regulator [Clostridium fungisolvens]GFP76493.1 Tetracycline repressor protein class B from transposon Tn10 [Clostridium fungisolvens]
MKEPIGKNKIIEKSWELLKEEGISGFSMRKLAKSVEMTVSSLYYHFESKEALFNEMIDQASGTIAYPINEREWDMRLRKYAENILSVLSEYAQLAQLLMMYPPTSSNYGKLMDNLLKIIENLNLSEENKLYAVNYYLNYILTFKLDSENMASNEKLNFTEGSGFSQSNTPYLYKLKSEGFFDKLGSREMFEFGLDIFINGIKVLEKSL